MIYLFLSLQIYATKSDLKNVQQLSFMKLYNFFFKLSFEMLVYHFEMCT